MKARLWFEISVRLLGWVLRWKYWILIRTMNPIANPILQRFSKGPVGAALCTLQLIAFTESLDLDDRGGQNGGWGVLMDFTWANAFRPRRSPSSVASRRERSNPGKRSQCLKTRSQ